MATYTPTATPTATPTPTPACEPEFILQGASAEGFNPLNTPFTVTLSCNTSAIDTNQNITIFANPETGTDMFGDLVIPSEVSESSITIPGFSTQGKKTVSIFAYLKDGTDKGTPIIQSFSLLFGSISMPVWVVDADGVGVANVTVKADATVYPGISQIGTTDATGLVTFTGLSSTTIGLFAQTADNSIGVYGLAATTGTVTLRLIPFTSTPSNVTDFRTEKGLLGWTGGTVLDVPVQRRAAQSLHVSTAGRTSLQSASASPKTYPFTKTVFIKYKFQTNEVPGGYFGTQFNDYYVVSIRSNTGGSTSTSRSMNALGLGAFDSSGATDWMQLQMNVSPQTEWVEFNVGVANVADGAYDSQVIVDQIGDLECEECGDCTKCPGDPMCQSTCKTPPPQSCAFYEECAEAAVQCGASGYPIAYGRRNCLAFQNDLNKFSSAGQSFIWGTMGCLQRALRDKITCDSTCGQVYNDAFDSHPKCYVDNGFCFLTWQDYVQVIITVNKDLITRKSLQQVLGTAGGCAQKYHDLIQAVIDELLQQALDDIFNAAVYLAKAAALKIIQEFILPYIS